MGESGAPTPSPTRDSMPDVLPLVSFVVPALDEALTLPGLLGDLAGFPLAHEVVVADGGSRDGTGARAAALGAPVIQAPRGRGTQLAAGARAARAPVLCFLHADVRLDLAALNSIAQAASHRSLATLRMHIDAAGLRFRLIERATNLRARAGLPYGDQGLVIPRELYDAAGGYADVPVMEDVAFVRALRRLGARPTLLTAAVSVSPRRWLGEGVWRRTLRNWSLLAAYYAGVSPERLARSYPPHPPAHG